MKAIVAAMALLLPTSGMVAAAYLMPRTHVIAEDYGGVLPEFKKAYGAIPSRDTFRIDGICASACTLVLSTDYHFKVCATARAEIWYHKPLFLDENDKLKTDNVGQRRIMSQVMWISEFLNTMPPDLRAYVSSKTVPGAYEGFKPNDALKITAPDLWRFVPKCAD